MNLATSYFPVLYFILSWWKVNAQQCTLDPSVFISFSIGLLNLQDFLTKPDISGLDCNSTEDCCVCEEGLHTVIACEGFEHALVILEAKNTSNISQVAVFIGREGNFTEYTIASRDAFEYYEHVALYGYGNVNLVCVNGTGLEFKGIVTLDIQNITLSKGYIFIENCVNVSMINVHVKDSPLTGCLIAISNQFLPQAVITGFNYTIRNSSFVNSGSDITYGGGGMNIFLEEYIAPIWFLIENCVFAENFADYGAGLYVEFRHLPITTDCGKFVPIFGINNCTFINNNARRHGGGVHFRAEAALFGAEFYNCSFFNNSAGSSGGAIYSSLQNNLATCNVYANLEFYGCVWSSNVAPLSAAINFQNSQQFQATVLLQKSKFESNSVNRTAFGGITLCIVHSSGMNLTLYDTEFTSNSGSGVCIRNSKLLIEGDIRMYRNSGFKGGAIYLDRNGWIYLKNLSRLILTENRAIYGGGIYQTSVTVSDTICFLESASTATVSEPFVLFEDNEAYTSGRSIFFENPSIYCEEEITKANAVFYPSGLLDQIRSSAYELKLTDLPNNTFNVILGQTLEFHANITDYFGHESTTFVNAFILPKSESLFENISYTLSGFTSFSMQNGLNNPTVYVVGPLNITENEFILKIASSQQFPELELTVSLNILGCVLGFIYNEDTNRCDCASTQLLCDFSTGRACIRRGDWHGTLTNGRYVIAACSSGNCKNIATKCTHCVSEGLTDYCELPQDEAEQCIGQWTGVLCTECLPGYSYTFGAQNCVHDSTCAKGAALVPTILMIIFLLAVIAFIVLILKFSYRIESGYVYSFVYYFSIVGFLLPANIVGTPLRVIVSVFESVTQLNPRFLGFIPVCISRDITILEQQMLLYLNPLIISIIVLGVIWLSRYCSRYLKFKDNTAVRAISLLILFSFTALTETSFNILNPVRFSNIDSTHVNIQPSTPYLNLKEHLPWFLIAVLVMILLVIPFTLLLLFAPLLVRYFNLTKIKPFLDEFQSCYKDNFRWMAGYYFLCRLIFLGILTAPVADNGSKQYSIQLISIVVLIVHMILQPYKNNWLNTIDSIFLADLVFLSLFYGLTAQVVLAEIDGDDFLQAVTFILVFIPMIYAFILLIIAAIRKIPDVHAVKEKASMLWSKRTSTGTSTTGNIQDTLQEPLVTTTEVSVDENSQYREPLLEVFDERSYNDSHSVTQYRRITAFLSSGIKSGTAITEHRRRGSSAQKWQEAAVNQEPSEYQQVAGEL